MDDSLTRNKMLHRRFLLVSGALLMFLSDMRGSMGILAWVMPVPFLVYIVRYKGLGSHLLLLLTLLIGSVLTLVKASSEPYSVSLGFALMSGIVTGVRYYLAFLIWGFVRKNVKDSVSIIAFPAIIVSLEYIQAFHTPIGVWGSLANTQLYNLPLLQIASLVGFVGISAMMAWAAVLVASIVLKGTIKAYFVPLISFWVVLISLGIFGDLRLSNPPEGEHVLVAAVMNNHKFTGLIPSPDTREVLHTTNDLIVKTRWAARHGAQIVVWGEASTVISETKEKAFVNTLSKLAISKNITIVAAYVVIPSTNGSYSKYRLLNKFTWIGRDGTLLETYFKHHTLLKGTMQGTSPLRLVHFANHKLAGAICFDYDFPKMSLVHSRLGAELIALPGLDWRGMMRRHTLMARLRAIEGGFSLIRPANDATSMGFDELGQIGASMSYFGRNKKVMLASLPLGSRNTIYSHIGNVFAYIAISIVLLILLRVLLKRLR